MTSPVISEPVGDGAYRVKFMMPSKYDLHTLPVPINKDVNIVEVHMCVFVCVCTRARVPVVWRRINVGRWVGGHVCTVKHGGACQALCYLISLPGPRPQPQSSQSSIKWTSLRFSFIL